MCDAESLNAIFKPLTEKMGLDLVAIFTPTESAMIRKHRFCSAIANDIDELARKHHPEKLTLFTDCLDQFVTATRLNSFRQHLEDTFIIKDIDYLYSEAAREDDLIEEAQRVSEAEERMLESLKSLIARIIKK